jgi:hypothetical protein
MPAGLTIKQQKSLSPRGQFVVGALTAGPLIVLFYLWLHHLPLHFQNRWLNLAAHLALIVIPLAWAAMMSSIRVSFEETEEIVLGRTGFLEKFPADWWTMLMLWPAALVGAFALGNAVFTKWLPRAEELSTTPLKALGIITVIFCLGFFYATILASNDEPRTLVSDAGLRTGMLRFFKWENIHHISKRGDLYSIYHRVNVQLPAASFKVHNPEARATLEGFLSRHQVRIADGADPFFKCVKVCVILGFVLIVLFAAWLRSHFAISMLWIVVISFVVGVVFTLLLEQVRGVPKHTKQKPVIQRG